MILFICPSLNLLKWVSLIAIPLQWSASPTALCAEPGIIYYVQKLSRAPMACGTYMAQKGISHSRRMSGTSLQLTQEEMVVEVPKLFKVAKEVGALATEALGHIGSI